MIPAAPESIEGASIEGACTERAPIERAGTLPMVVYGA
jgi:hypothetical protein